MVKHVNLLIPELSPRFDPFALKNVLLAAGGLTLVLSLMSANALWQRQTDAARQKAAEKTLAELQAAVSETGKALAERRPSKVLEDEILRTQNNLQSRAAAIRALASNTGLNSASSNRYSSILAALGRQTMEGVWLTGMDVVGEDIEIRGKMRDHALLPTYLQKLNAEPTFQQFRFSALAMKGVAPSPASAAAAGSTTPASTEAPFVEFALRTSQHSLRPEESKEAKSPIPAAIPDTQQLPPGLIGLLSDIELVSRSHPKDAR